MIFPVSTDAPVYHYPIATIGLIVTNTVVFFITGMGLAPWAVDPWILWFGELHAFQWFSAMFMHAGALHLLGNMIFLWSFGLITEGKLGWWRFLLLYLMMGMLQFGAEQILMLGADREATRQQQLHDTGMDPTDWPPNSEERIRRLASTPQKVQSVLRERPFMFGALGASGAIYSLMALSLIWAPANELSVILLIFLRPFRFEVTVLKFAVFYIGLDFLLAWAQGFTMSTALLHTAGAITGAIVGVVMFKMGLVDCEDWDLFAVMSGHYGPHVRDIYGFENPNGRRTKYSHLEVPTDEDKPKKPKRTRLKKVAELIEQGGYAAAAEDLIEYEMKARKGSLPRQHHKVLAKGLLAEDGESEIIESVLESYLTKYEQDSSWAQLRIAALQLERNRQPRASLETLEDVELSELTDEELKLCKAIGKAAKKQIAAGVEDQSDW